MLKSPVQKLMDYDFERMRTEDKAVILIHSQARTHIFRVGRAVNLDDELREKIRKEWLEWFDPQPNSAWGFLDVFDRDCDLVLFFDDKPDSKRNKK